MYIEYILYTHTSGGYETPFRVRLLLYNLLNVEIDV